MNGAVLFLTLCVALINGSNIKVDPKRQWQRIVGGDPTTIYEYPYSVSAQARVGENVFSHICGGSILTSTAILSAAHCYGTTPNPLSWSIRAGSTYHASGGNVYLIRQITNHPNFSFATGDSDVSILRTSTNIVYGPAVQPVPIAGTNYNLGDNEVVWAIGWGSTLNPNESNAMLRHVQIWTVNQEICRARYGNIIFDTMLCAGWLDVGGRDQCGGDSGSPLLHHGVAVGVCSWGYACGDPYYPGVNARVSVLSSWIVATAQA